MIDIFSHVRSGNFDEYSSTIGNVNVNIKNDDGANLLHMAVAYGKSDIALDLLARGINIDDRNGEGMSALISSVISKRHELAATLLGRGADACIRDSYGNNALWYAIGSPRVDYVLVKLILEKGADPYERTTGAFRQLTRPIELEIQSWSSCCVVARREFISNARQPDGNRFAKADYLMWARDDSLRCEVGRRSTRPITSRGRHRSCS